MRVRRSAGLLVAVMTVLGVMAPQAHAVLAPDAPTALTAVAEDQAIELSWETPADNGVPITGYRIYVETADGSNTIDTGSTTPAYRHDGLNNGIEYTYSVTAINTLGFESAQSDSATATPLGVPTAPQDLVGRGVWTGQRVHVDLTWSAPASDGGSSILGFRVYRDSVETPIAELGPDASSFSERISGEGATYSVTAFNAVGEGDPAATTISQTVWFFKPIDVTLRDADGDVVRSDSGGPLYSGSQDFSRIIDRNQISPYSGFQDVMTFQPWGKRHFDIQHAAIADGQRLTCDGFSAVSIFSRQNQDWFTTLEAAADGASLAVDAALRCVTNGSGADYMFDFPNHDTSTASTECGVITKIDASTYAFEAPATCLADIYTTSWTRGQYTRELVIENVSAPSQLTATLE